MINFLPPRTYFVDIVVCFDASAHMASAIEKIKQFTQNLYTRIIDVMEENSHSIDQLRVKIIAFRDYESDSEAMIESPFYTLPEQSMEFRGFVDSLEFKGGNGPKNALEAIAQALKSEWTTDGTRRRHVVCVFADSPALPLGARTNCPSYPQGIPASLSELGDWWENLVPGSTYQPQSGRLIAFVPEVSPWTDLQAWNRYWPAFSNAGTGLEEVDIQQAIDMVVYSF